MNKKKIFNDPIYGFITVQSELIFDIIDHPFIQRLRRIKQLGLTDLVYPGALHTRFHHALGAMHLMKLTLDNLRGKGQEISENEYEATMIAVLLHDVGHGPFSHALEKVLIPRIDHEFLSRIIIQRLAEELGGNIYLALQIFNDEYERKFFHQLVSSQLDIDRLDYLKRDCFFTGVSEGSIGSDRIIKMLDVLDDQIVVEEKGIYSIENFLNARRLMYWQVYLHKTCVSAEKMLLAILRRAKELIAGGEEIFASNPLKTLLLEGDKFTGESGKNQWLLEQYLAIDDHDLWGAIKIWSGHKDHVLARLSSMLLERRLFKTSITNKPFGKQELEDLKQEVGEVNNMNNHEVSYFVINGTISNAAYISGSQKINILTKAGEVLDIAQASDLPNVKAMSKIVRKYYLCWPKNINLHNKSNNDESFKL